MFCRVSQTIVERHHDVGSKRPLNIHSAFGTQKVSASVEVAPKADAIFTDVAQRAQAEYLVSTAVSEYWPIPSHELMQSTQSPYRFMPGPQHQVIGITEQNLYRK